MKLLYNRRVAVGITAVVVLLAILFGSHRSLMQLRDRAEQIFYQGEKNDGLSIQHDLEERLSLSYQLVSLSKSYLEPDSPQISAALEARERLEQAKGPALKCESNRRLSEAMEDLYRVLGETELSEEDSAHCTRLYQNLRSCDDTISHDGYNRFAEGFNEILSKSPASFLSKLTSVKSLELYR